MKGTTKMDERFFESTRGQIVRLLRDSSKTVNDIAAELELTDNAIRAHLLSLERDNLVEQKGVVKGFRKPHFVYGLTDEGRNLFPKAYDSLLNNLLSALKSRLVLSVLKDFLAETGRRIGRQQPHHAEDTLDDKLSHALSTLEELGGSATVVKENGHVVIKSEGCPFAEAVSEHPEVCQVAESMLSEIVGKPVKETSDRTGSPKCRFDIPNA
jgi:predicted ArsR family transcriptional regulator